MRPVMRSDARLVPVPEPPTFDGPAVLGDDAALADWLRATWAADFARLRNLPTDEGTAQRPPRDGESLLFGASR